MRLSEVRRGNLHPKERQEKENGENPTKRSFMIFIRSWYNNNNNNNNNTEKLQKIGQI